MHGTFSCEQSQLLKAERSGAEIGEYLQKPEKYCWSFAFNAM